MSGWCSADQHAGRKLEFGTSCPEYTRVWHMEKKKVVVEGYRKCSCFCHGNTRKRTNKKAKRKK